MSGMAWRLGERYELYSQLAVSASCTVWRGLDVNDGAQCVVKVLHPELVADPAAVADAQRTLSAVAALGHQGVVAVDEMVVHEGHVALVSRFVPGLSLRTLVEEHGPVPAEQATSFASQISSALAAVHAAGFEHGNLTAAQVLIDTGRGAPGEAVVTDFGIATLVNRAAARGALPHVPAPRYQAPELRPGDPGTPTADVFALGVLFYEALSGRHPFALSGEDDPVLVVRDSPEPIAGLSLSLWNLITGCLAPNPINRPTAAHIARLLASRVPPAPTQVSTPPAVAPGPAHAPATMAVAAAAVTTPPAPPAPPSPSSPSAAPSPEESPTIFMPVIRTGGDLAAQPGQGAEQAVEASSNIDGHRRRAGSGRRRVALSGLGLGAVAVAAIVAFTGFQSGGSNASDDKNVPVVMVPHSGEPDFGAGPGTASTRTSASASSSAHASASASSSASASASATKSGTGPLAVGATSATPDQSASTLAPPTNVGNAPSSGSNLVNGRSGTCLDTQNNAFADGATEQLWTCGGAAGESWTLAANGALTQDGGAYCLDDYAFGTSSGSRVALWSCNNGANQRWTMRSDGSVQNVYSGLCLDVSDQSTANGAQIVLTTCGWHSTQRWSWQ